MGKRLQQFQNLDEIAEKLQSTGALGSDAGQASKPKAFGPKHLFTESKEDQELGKKYTYQSIPAQGKTKGY